MVNILSYILYSYKWRKNKLTTFQHGRQTLHKTKFLGSSSTSTKLRCAFSNTFSIGECKLLLTTKISFPLFEDEENTS